ILVGNVTETDCLRGTCRLAGGYDFAVADTAVVLVGFDVRGFDALDAVRAFLHHAATAHRHFRVAHRHVLRCVLVGVLHEVEPPHLVRAVVGTKTRADAAVVHLHVQAFGVVHGRIDRTHHFARRVFAHH